MNEKTTQPDPRTPQEHFERLDKDFHFTLDPVGSITGHRKIHPFAIPSDGLAASWEGERVFCWPADGDSAAWVQKCAEEGKKPDTMVVLLAPAKTDASYFHDFIDGQCEVRFLRGRLQLSSRPACGSLLAIYRGPSPDSKAIKYVATEFLAGHPMTAAELTDLLQRSGYPARVNGITSRLSELKREGRIIGVGKRICKVSGSKATVWTVTGVSAC